MAIFRQLWLKFVFLLKSLLFLRYSLQALWYSLRRDFRHRAHRVIAETSLVSVGKGLQASTTEQGVHFEFEQASLDLVFLTPDFVRVTWQPGRLPIPYAIAYEDWETVSFSLEEQGQGWVVTSEALTITVGWDGSVTVADAVGQIVRRDLPPQQRGEGWQQTTLLRSEECLYGLGERALSFNLRAAAPGQFKTYQFWNYDPGNIYEPGTDPMYICIPVYLGLHQLGSYLVFYENTFRGDLKIGEHLSSDENLEKFGLAQSATIAFESGSLRSYLAVGAPPLLMQRYTQLTGRPPLPPRWALGYHQSRWGYGSETVVRREVQEFLAYDLPLSAIHLDIDCQVHHRSFTLDPKRFPNFRQFTADLAEQGVRLVAINNPGIQHSRKSNLFLEGQILNAFCTYPNGDWVVAPVWAGWSVFPDFTDPVVRDWWSQQFGYLLKAGVAGFWNDMNEPAAFVLWGDPTLPLMTQHCLEGRGGDHREAHNVYGLLETRAAFESLRVHRPDTRPFMVSRSGWAGLQRYAWTWTGDIISTWEALRQTIPTILGLGLSGIAFCGPDIGGFLGNPGAELYLRWFQMATFLVFYRTHCAISVAPRAPWSYGEPYLSILRRFLQLRQQLMPYLYTLIWEAAEVGHPPVRPLFWLDPTQESLWNRDDAFCLGDALLVCPVMAEGLRSQRIHLPSGHWYSFWDDRFLAGAQTVELAAPLEQIPLLVRAGSILPLAEEDDLVLHLYPYGLGECQSRVYSDAGEGYGDSRLDYFDLQQQENRLTLTWQHQGNYAFPYAGVRLQLHGAILKGVGMEEEAQPIQGQTLRYQSFQRLCLEIQPESTVME